MSNDQTGTAVERPGLRPLRRLHLSAQTPAPLERVLETAWDFSRRREEVWPNVSMKSLEVHQIAESFADVTEGLGSSRFFFERGRYDWSQPGIVTQTVTDSNILQPGTTWEIRATSGESATNVEVTFAREYKRTLKGRFAELLFRVAGKQLASWDLRRALAKIERGEPGQ
jgi:hypothetical protein